MAEQNLLELAEWIQKQALKAGADEVTVHLSTSQGVEIEYRDDRVEKLKSSQQRSLQLEIYADRRFGVHSTNDLRQDSLAEFIPRAVAMVRYLEEDPYRALPDPEMYQGQSEMDLELEDAGYDQITLDERIERTREMVASIQGSDERIISIAADYYDSRYEQVTLRSNGFAGTERGTYFVQGTTVSLQEDNGRKPEGWRYYQAHHLGDLPGLSQTAQEALQRARDRLGREKIQGGTLRMLLENRAASRLLGHLLSALSGSAIQQKRSFLAGLKGHKIASDLFTLTDEPLIKRGLGSRLFDSDGLPAHPLPLITEGHLENYYIDVYYSRKLGTNPTTGGPSNLVLRPGEKSLEELERDIKRGILVTDFLGGNANSTTGDFSLGISGWLVEDGRRIQPVGEMNITGNFRELLPRLVAVGNDPDLFSGSLIPSLLFEGVNFSGK